MLLLVAGLVLYIAALTVTCLYALRRGGRTERHATIALLLGAAASQLGGSIGPDWLGPSYWIMAVDAALLVTLILIARRSEQFWPVWVAAAQLCGLITHLAVVVHANVVTELYLLTQPFWVFPMLAGIAWGTWAHQSTALSKSE